MSIVRWRPLGHVSDLTRWGGAFDRFFGDVGASDWDSLLSGRAWNPSIDIYEEEGSIVVKAEVPGMAKEDISVEVHDGVLTIKGEKKEKKEDEGKHFYRAERMYGCFERSFSLPEGVYPDAIKAGYKGGVLELRIPKVEEKKPVAKKIEVVTD